MNDPYEDLPTTEKKSVSGRVSIAHHNRIHLAFPYKGMQNKIISTLYHKFVEAADKQGLPEYYDLDNEQKIEQLLESITFTPSDQNG